MFKTVEHFLKHVFPPKEGTDSPLLFAQVFEIFRNLRTEVDEDFDATRNKVTKNDAELLKTKFEDYEKSMVNWRREQQNKIYGIYSYFRDHEKYPDDEYTNWSINSVSGFKRKVSCKVKTEGEGFRYDKVSV